MCSSDLAILLKINLIIFYFSFKRYLFEIALNVKSESWLLNTIPSRSILSLSDGPSAYCNVTLSREEFDIKKNKGVLDSAWAENRVRHNYEHEFDLYNNREHIFDDILSAWVPKVKEAIQKRYYNDKSYLTQINH